MESFGVIPRVEHRLGGLGSDRGGVEVWFAEEYGSCDCVVGRGSYSPTVGGHNCIGGVFMRVVVCHGFEEEGLDVSKVCGENFLEGVWKEGFWWVV